MIGIRRQNSISDLYVDRLVERLERCAGDGIDCEKCPVQKECLNYWDRVCEQTTIDEYKFLEIAVIFADIRDRKYHLASISSKICHD